MVKSDCTERLLGLTVRRGKDVVSSVQTQHWHLHRLQRVDRTGIVVVVIIGGIAKHYGGEPLVKLSNGLCLQGRSKLIKRRLLRLIRLAFMAECH